MMQMLNTTGIQLCSLGVKKVKTKQTKQKKKQNKTKQIKTNNKNKNKTKQKQKQKTNPPKKSGYCKVLSFVLLFQEIANGVIFLTTIIPLSENNNM